MPTFIEIFYEGKSNANIGYGLLNQYCSNWYLAPGLKIRWQKGNADGNRIKPVHFVLKGCWKWRGHIIVQISCIKNILMQNIQDGFCKHSRVNKRWRRIYLNFLFKKKLIDVNIYMKQMCN